MARHGLRPTASPRWPPRRPPRSSPRPVTGRGSARRGLAPGRTWLAGRRAFDPSRPLSPGSCPALLFPAPTELPLQLAPVGPDGTPRSRCGRPSSSCPSHSSRTQRPGPRCRTRGTPRNRHGRPRSCPWPAPGSTNRIFRRPPVPRMTGPGRVLEDLDLQGPEGHVAQPEPLPVAGERGPDEPRPVLGLERLQESPLAPEAPEMQN